MSSLKPILLVEDDPRDVELTLNTLVQSRLANEVVVARDGAEAAAMLFPETGKGLQPGMILLDIKLPKLGGLDLLARIRETPATQALPVVMLTASGEEADLARSHALGINAYVVKPVSLQAFQDALYELGTFWGIMPRRT
ncbi:response regulator [Telmatospirillum sp. J64-1]|uniref:response regulator n=1 Tax=Telmatospirillum sp. J64-1 TaxID=2502183 RepID=UPI00115E5E95|nr:response regulator [Telmatospirillum sp. J64-1]